jgi:hypothetical protein
MEGNGRVVVVASSNWQLAVVARQEVWRDKVWQNGASDADRQKLGRTAEALGGWMQGEGSANAFARQRLAAWVGSGRRN